MTDRHHSILAAKVSVLGSAHRLGFGRFSCLDSRNIGRGSLTPIQSL